MTPKKTNVNLDSIDQVVETFSSLEKGSLNLKDAISRIAKLPEVDNGVAIIEANIIANQTSFGENKFIEEFESKFFSDLGIDNKSRKEKGYDELHIKVMPESQYKDTVEKFTQTVNTTTGGFVGLPQILKTNFSNILNTIFFETSIMGDITMYSEGTDNEEIREMTNVRTATNGNETLNATPANDAVDTITLNPNSVRVVDAQNVTINFEESKNAVDAATLFAEKLRAVRNRAETLIIGTNSGTNNAGFTIANSTSVTPATRNGQIYSILNNLPVSGLNRGARIINPVGVGVVNHIDALNYAIQQTKGIQTLSDISGFVHYMNLETAMSVVRTINTYGNNLYYWDTVNNTITSLLFQVPIKIVSPSTLLNWQVVTCKPKDFRAKVAQMPRYKTNITSLANNTMELVCDMFFDGAPTNAFKNIAAKNNYTAMILEADGNYAT